LKLLDLPQGVTPPIVLRWSPDGRDIAFINTEEGRSNLWLQPVAGGTSRQLTNFTSDQIFSFDWTTDGRVLAYARGMTINDVVTIKDSSK
jgi:Tol biopolymer transport system component